MEGDACRVPGAARILTSIGTDMRIMASPVLAVDGGADIAARLNRLLKALPEAPDDRIDPAAVLAITRAGHHGGDSLHRLVMDLHRRLNALEGDLAEEIIDGAAAHGLAAADRPLVKAFMAGVNRTAPLKFDHPGLQTLASGAGPRLTIQNDIGSTDAHVIVIHVEAGVVSVTYSDVHADRLAFFQSMLAADGFCWSVGAPAALADGEAVVVGSGQAAAGDPEACARRLEHLGSRLVFLIDWNRARKALRGFLRKEDRLALLAWAAETEIGHRGFLEIGSAAALASALEAAAGSAMRFGDRLCDVIGDPQAVDLLREVFTLATNGRLAGDSAGLTGDRVRLAAAARFGTEEARLFGLAGDHGGLMFELASLARDGLEADPPSGERLAGWATRLTVGAVEIAAAVQTAIRRRPDLAEFAVLLEPAQKACDELARAVFLAPLAPSDGKSQAALRDLAESVVSTCQEWIKALADARGVDDQRDIQATDDFLIAADRLANQVSLAAQAERALTMLAFEHARDFRELQVQTTLGAHLRAAAAAVGEAGLVLRRRGLGAAFGPGPANG